MTIKELPPAEVVSESIDGILQVEVQSPGRGRHRPFYISPGRSELLLKIAQAEDWLAALVAARDHFEKVDNDRVEKVAAVARTAYVGGGPQGGWKKSPYVEDWRRVAKAILEAVDAGELS